MNINRKLRNRVFVISACCVLFAFFLLSQRTVPSVDQPTRDKDEERGAVAAVDGGTEYQGDDIATDDKVDRTETGTVPEVCNAPLRFLPAGKRRKNPVTLASFPGSGNTWLRFLIEQGSRVYTGSAYQDGALNETYPGEGMMGTDVIAVKTHYPCPNCWTFQKCPWCAGTLPVTADMTGIVKGADAAVFMMRSPFDALLAEFHRLRTGMHAGKLKPEAFSKVPSKKSYETEYDKPTWSQFINQRLVAYALAARTYLDHPTEARSPQEAKSDVGQRANDEFLASDRFVSRGGKLTKLVFYEKLKADPYKELNSIFAFFQDIYESEGLKDSVLSPPALAAECSVYHNMHAQKSHFRWLRNNTEVFNPWKPAQVKQVCAVLGKWWFKEVWGECMDGKLQIQRNLEKS